MNEINPNNPNQGQGEQPQPGIRPAPFPPGEGAQPQAPLGVEPNIQPTAPQTPPQQPGVQPSAPQGGVPRPPREEETVDIRTMNDDVSSVESSGGSVGEPKTFRPKDLLNDEPQFKPDQTIQPNLTDSAGQPAQPPKKKGLRMLILSIVGVLLFAGIAYAGFVFVPRFFADPAPVVIQPEIQFTVEPTSIESGQTATLTWNVADATEVNIEGVGAVESAGSLEITPVDTTTYRIVAVGAGGTSESTVEVVVVSTGPQFQHVSMFTADANVVQVPLLMDAASVTTFHNLLTNAATNWEEGAVVEILPLLNNQPINSYQFFGAFLPALSEDYLIDTIAEDYTVFAYKDSNGVWPGFMVSIKEDMEGNAMNYSELTNAIKQLPTVFYSADPGAPQASGFQAGTKFSASIQSIEYLPYAAPGASFVITIVESGDNDHINWSTSFNGIKEAFEGLGL